MKLIKLKLLLFVLTISSFAYSSNNWYVELQTGNSAKVPNNLIVEQNGYETVIVRNARYETRPWSNTNGLLGLTENYYSARIGFSPDERWSYEVELLHDKVYYVSGQDSGIIDHFEITDGLNSLFGNLAYSEKHGDFEAVFRVGVGAAIPNPATVIRGKASGTRNHLGEGSRYYLAGISGQVTTQLRYFLTSSFGLSTELRYVVTYLNLPINDGRVNAWFHGPHVNFGVIFRF